MVLHLLMQASVIMDITDTMTMDENENTDLGVAEYDAASAVQKNAAVKVVSSAGSCRYRNV